MHDLEDAINTQFAGGLELTPLSDAGALTPYVSASCGALLMLAVAAFATATQVSGSWAPEDDAGNVSAQLNADELLKAREAGLRL